ncbi:MAG TPA: replication initiation factor domain-containing protein [Victivallales bacterium]|nr:replication initiation factor domain-containing protein [Victivallales bacterium]|tara:strand:+ start:34 stop:1152 length:1119 start_codon:yes stop_codon:yes gene_type:complete
MKNNKNLLNELDKSKKEIVTKTNFIPKPKLKIIDVIDEYASPFSSIDRITFLILSDIMKEANNRKNPDSYIDNFLSKLDMTLLKLGLIEVKYMNSDNYKVHYKLKGEIDLQLIPKFGVKERVTDKEVLEVIGSEEDRQNGYIDFIRPSNYPIRIDYNPNKGDLSQIEKLLKFFNDDKINFEEMIKITRVDVAIDYPEDINLALINCEGMRKSFLAIGCNGIESVYFGTQKSKYYFRIYNKKLELLQKQKLDYKGEHLYRVELQNREGFLLSEAKTIMTNIFSKLQFFEFPFNTGNPDLDFFVYYAKDFGLKSALSKYEKSKKSRLKQALSKFEFTPLDHPSVIFEKQFPQVWSDFIIKLKILFRDYKQGDLI